MGNAQVSGRLDLLQMFNGSQLPTCMIWGRHQDGTVLAQHGLSITQSDQGEPIAMDLAAAWQTIDLKTLTAAIKNAEWVQEENLPITTPRQGYRQGLMTTGIVVKLQPEDAVTFGADLSVARFVQEDGSFIEVPAVIAVTQRALNALGFGVAKISYATKATKPYDVGDLLTSLDYVRANGAVEYPHTFQNGDRSDRIGFPKGTQKTSMDLAVSEHNAALAQESILSRINPGVRVRNEQPRQQYAPRRQFSTPPVSY